MSKLEWCLGSCTASTILSWVPSLPLALWEGLSWSNGEASGHFEVCEACKLPRCFKAHTYWPDPPRNP